MTHTALGVFGGTAGTRMNVTPQVQLGNARSPTDNILTFAVGLRMTEEVTVINISQSWLVGACTKLAKLGMPDILRKLTENPKKDQKCIPSCQNFVVATCARNSVRQFVSGLSSSPDAVG